MNVRRLFGALCLLGLLLMAAFGKPVYRRIEARLTQPPPEIVMTGTPVQVSGREYLIWLPDKPTGAPVLLALHGAARGAEKFGDASGLAQAATTRGYVVIAPLGTSRRQGGIRNWNAGHCCAYAFLQKIDEAAFLDAVLADAENRFGLDASKLYVAGMSSGGMTGLRYALTRPGRVTAAASIAGMPDPALMPPAHPVPILLIHGNKDEVMYFEGGFVADEEVGPGGGYMVMGAEETAAEWATAMGAGDPVDRKINPRWNFSDVTERDWAVGGQSAVRLMIVGGGLHRWSGGQEDRDAEISATEEILRFFADHGGPGAAVTK